MNDALIIAERKKILALIEAQPQCTVRALYVAKHLNVRVERARRLLGSLVESGDLEVINSEGGFYEWGLL